jgi:tripartite ATP-independent transporter DctP family solute receptor
MARVKFGIAVSVGVALGLLHSAPTRAEGLQLKLAHVAQPGTAVDDAVKMFADKISKVSAGRLDIQDFNNSQLGGERDYIEGMQIGSLEMAVTSTGVLGTFDKNVDLLSLPFLFRSPEHLDHVLDGLVGAGLAARLQPLGIHVLAWFDYGPRYIFNTKHPIYSPEEMKGLKFRVIESPIFVAAYKALGARAVPMARPEVYSALKQGVLDGLDNSLSFYSSMGDYEVAKYATMKVPLFQTPAALMISEKTFEGLSPDLRKLLTDTAQAIAPIQRQMLRSSDERIAEALKQKGVIEVDGDPAPFEQAAHAVWTDFANQVGGDQAIQAVVNTK